MQFWYEHIWAEESGGSPFTETFTADFPSTDVLVTCALQQVNQQGLNGKAQIAITSYVQNGSPFNGSWQILNGNNITSVTFSLTVTNALAQGTGLVLAINE
jgi:hypothetical protein